ncbi:MAG: hypothetical protein ACRC9V_11670 [Aeromonas sp.]
MTEQQYGQKILAEMQRLYLTLKDRKPKYGQKGLKSLILEHVPSLARAPQFERKLASLILQDTSWGRRVFIEAAYELIGQHFDISVPVSAELAHKVPSTKAFNATDPHRTPSYDQFLCEAKVLWVALKDGHTCWGLDDLSPLVARCLATLPYDPALKAEVDALLARKSGWGRNAFINGLYRLIGDRYGVIEVPFIEAKPRRI